MRFFQKKYVIVDHYGGTYIFTASQLYNRVMKDSKYDYNWIAPANELVRICNESDFPENYAIAIKVAILNCSANIAHKANLGFDQQLYSSEENDALHFCYNSLYNVHTRECLEARRRYLFEMISSATYVYVSSPFYHAGPTYKNIQENFIKSNYEKYVSQEYVDFNQLLDRLNFEFLRLVKSAEDSGSFEDDAKA